MAERSMAVVLKTTVGKTHRGFESLSLRQPSKKRVTPVRLEGDTVRRVKMPDAHPPSGVVRGAAPAESKGGPVIPLTKA
jgi:hypothetical protein